MILPYYCPPRTSSKQFVQGFSYEHMNNLMLDINAYYLEPRHCQFQIRRLLYDPETHGEINNLTIQMWFDSKKIIKKHSFQLKIDKIVDEETIINQKLNFDIRPANLDQTQKIPKKIFQTGKTNDVSDPVLAATCDIVRQKNPEYEYYFFDDNKCRTFLQRHFGDITLAAFDKLNPGAFKADLWRYAALYVYGGVYIDMDLLEILPLRELIEPDANLILIKDEVLMGGRTGLYQALIAITPKSIIMKRCLEKTVHNVMTNYYGTGLLAISGPVMMGRQVKLLLGMKQTTIFEPIRKQELKYTDENNNVEKNITTIFHLNARYICTARSEGNKQLFRFKLIAGVSPYAYDFFIRNVYKKTPTTEELEKE